MNSDITLMNLVILMGELKEYAPAHDGLFKANNKVLEGVT